MTDFQSFLLGNINLFGGNGNTTTTTTTTANTPPAKSSLKKQTKNNQIDYGTITSTATTTYTVDTLLPCSQFNTKDNKNTLSSSSSSSLTAVDADYLKMKNAYSSSTSKNTTTDEEEPVVPKRRQKPPVVMSVAEIKQQTELNDTKNEVISHEERDSERDAQSPKPIRASISQRILKKLKNSNIKSMFNPKNEPQSSSLNSSRNEVSNQTSRQIEVPQAPNAASSDIDLSKLLAIVSLLSQNGLKIDEKQLATLTAGLSSTVNTQNPTPVDVQQKQKIDRNPATLEAADETQISSSDDYSWASQAARPNNHNDNHLYNEINEQAEMAKRRRAAAAAVVATSSSTRNNLKGMKQKNLKSDAEDSVNDDDDGDLTTITTSSGEFENFLNGNFSSSFCEDEDEEDESGEDELKGHLKTRLNDLAKLKRPERQILYKDWFKIIKKLETDPKFDLETLVRTRGRFTDHVMISYRDRLKYLKQQKLSQQPLDACGGGGLAVMRQHSAADLNFFTKKEQPKHRFDSNPDETAAAAAVAATAKLPLSAAPVMSRTLKLTLNKSDVDMIKDKLLRNSRENKLTSKLTRLLDVCCTKNNNAENLSFCHEKPVRNRSSQQQQPPANNRCSTQDFDVADFSPHQTPAKLKNKNKIGNAAKGFCNGLSRMVKDKIEKPLKSVRQHSADVDQNNNNNNNRRERSKPPPQARHDVDNEQQERFRRHSRRRLENIDETISDHNDGDENFSFVVDDEIRRQTKRPPPKRPPPPRPSMPQEQQRYHSKDEQRAMKQQKPERPIQPQQFDGIKARSSKNTRHQQISPERPPSPPQQPQRHRRHHHHHHQLQSQPLPTIDDSKQQSKHQAKLNSKNTQHVNSNKRRA